ncbi:putative nucleotidyltransferase substrate binding domain-containing protein [Iodobacter sp.]|uniref:putative nucleotidyltransferase substrate binding domain-containing protein n=1 Tax=Iodobacter sp. TaxID=1915058 RepID=UPI0025DBD389|nr:putative nucleotidyltransferase substrate binding domain-containing protein [Iodobacter sp.]
MTASFDFNRSPFSSLTAAERDRLSAALDISYFAAGHFIQQLGQQVDALLVVMKGLVSEEGTGDEAVFYGAFDVLDSKSLLSAKACGTLRAVEDTLLWHIKRDVVMQISDANRQFAAFFYADVARKLAALDRPVQELQPRVGDAVLHPPCWLAESASVLDAAKLMKRTHSRAVLVQEAAGVGIFTQSDLRNVVADGLDAQHEAIYRHISRQLICVKAEDDLHHAMLLMMRHSVQRLIVQQDEQICGVLEQIDLMSALANNPRSITAQIGRAQHPSALLAAVKSTQQLIISLNRSGMKITLLAELLAEIRHRLFSKLFSLLAPPEMLSHVCLLVLGSEGRGEQILNTDQDNALIIADGYQHPDLQRVCNDFTAHLIELGYPPCPGEVMISNPIWRQSVTAYKRQMDEWSRSASSENVMNMAIWQDARPVCGQSALFDELGDYLTDGVADSAAFLSRFAFPVEQFATPINLFSRLIIHAGADKNCLDLKKGGIFPLVHGVRSLALQYQIKESNSYRRIQCLIALGHLNESFGRDMSESLAFLQGLQLKLGLARLAVDKPVDNLLDPAQLTTLERELLKDTLRVVKQFRQLISHHFKLGML